MEHCFKISLAAARVNAKLSQSDVAEKTGMSRATIINWEKGATTPNLLQFYGLCKLYEIPPDYIFLPSKST